MTHNWKQFAESLEDIYSLRHSISTEIAVILPCVLERPCQHVTMFRGSQILNGNLNAIIKNNNNNKKDDRSVKSESSAKFCKLVKNILTEPQNKDRATFKPQDPTDERIKN